MLTLLEDPAKYAPVEEWRENGGDSLDEFKKNLKTQPEDWYWRHNKLTYTFNKQGYRCPEWDTIDWNNSILFFGGSDVFGIGVSDHDTCSYRLQQRINTPVINLGCPGSSPMFHWINSVRLRKYGATPLKVIYIWPPSARIPEFGKYPDHIVKFHWGPWFLRAGFGHSWVRHRYQGDYFLKETIDCCDVLWNCPVYHFYTDLNKIHIYDYVTNSYELPQKIDTARDLLHPGIDTFRSWASYIESVMS